MLRTEIKNYAAGCNNTRKKIHKCTINIRKYSSGKEIDVDVIKYLKKMYLCFCIRRGDLGRCVAGIVVYGCQAKSPLLAPVVQMCCWRENAELYLYVLCSLFSNFPGWSGCWSAYSSKSSGRSGHSVSRVLWWTRSVRVSSLPVRVGTLLWVVQVNSVIRSSH